VKRYYEFENDLMKMCFEHKKKEKKRVDHKIKKLELCKFVFLSLEFVIFDKTKLNI